MKTKEVIKTAFRFLPITIIKIHIHIVLKRSSSQKIIFKSLSRPHDGKENMNYRRQEVKSSLPLNKTTRKEAEKINELNNWKN